MWYESSHIFHTVITEPFYLKGKTCQLSVTLMFSDVFSLMETEGNKEVLFV